MLLLSVYQITTYDMPRQPAVSLRRLAVGSFIEPGVYKPHDRQDLPIHSIFAKLGNHMHLSSSG